MNSIIKMENEKKLITFCIDKMAYLQDKVVEMEDKDKVNLHNRGTFFE
jgi:hypothetical protein